VQLPEKAEIDNFPTLADITKERVRRVAKGISEQNRSQNPSLFTAEKQSLDLGFKVFKLSESNFKTWNPTLLSGDVTALNEQLEMHIDHIKPGRTQDDILYEILLKSGFPLTTKIEKLLLAGKTVFSVSDNEMFICLEKELTFDLIKEIATRKPYRVVCLDEGFSGNDQLKTNAVQTMKAKGVVSFRTV
jgi:adenine-specific DNA-methyltransferase